MALTQGGGDRDFEDTKAVAERLWGSGKVKLSPDDMIAEGNRVAVWATSKQEGRSDSHGCVIFRLDVGKIVESWNMISLQSQAFGELPPPKE